MKIVYISNSVLPSKNANSIHVMKMCQALSDLGHEVILLAPDRYKEQEGSIENLYDFYDVKKCFEIVFLPYSYQKFFKILYYTFNVAKKISELQPDLIYGRDLYSCFIMSILEKNIVYEIHAPMNNKIKTMLLNIMTKRRFYKKTVAISNVLKNIILKHQNILERDIVVAHDAADVPQYFDDSTSKINLKKGKLNVGYVGSLYSGKGIEVIVAIANNLPDVNFHVVGGKEKDLLFWKERANSSNIIFHGFTAPKYIPQYLKQFDIVLLPNQENVFIENKTEMNIGEYTSPLKLFEYMASKKVIVASNLPVLKEVLNESNSILVNPTDYENWCQSIEKLKDVKLRNKLAEKAYEDFQQNYSWKIRAEKILTQIAI